MSISILYMFRAAMCPSLGELIVSIRHLVYVTLYRWLFCVQVETQTIWRYLIPSRGICLFIDSPRWTLLCCFRLYTAVYWLSF